MSLGRWHPLIQSFRSVNEKLAENGRPSFPDEIILMVETVLMVTEQLSANSLSIRNLTKRANDS